MGRAARAHYIEWMKLFVAGVVIAVLAACASSSPSSPSSSPKEPTESTRPAPVQDRFAASLALMERFVTAVEPAAGDCKAIAARLTAFSQTEDGDAMRAMVHDTELRDYVQTHHDEIASELEPLGNRVSTLLDPCNTDADFDAATQKAHFFEKVKVDEEAAGDVD
jgi:hypothetical protein